MTMQIVTAVDDDPALADAVGEAFERDRLAYSRLVDTRTMYADAVNLRNDLRTLDRVEAGAMDLVVESLRLGVERATEYHTHTTAEARRAVQRLVDARP